MRTLLTIFLIGFSSTIFSQINFLKKRDPDLEIGMNSKFNLSTFEIGVNYFDTYGGSCTTIASDAIMFSSEFGMKGNSFLYAPKITYSGNLLFLNASFSAINYNYSNNYSLYVRPQLGLTTFGYIDLVYGYNIPIVDRSHEFQGSMLTLRCKMDFFKEILLN